MRMTYLLGRICTTMSVLVSVGACSGRGAISARSGDAGPSTCGSDAEPSCVGAPTCVEGGASSESGSGGEDAGREDTDGAREGGNGADAAASYAFPLKLAPGQRYIVDQNGTPFLLKGDCGWSIITTLTLADATVYMQDRASRGFNTVWIGLMDNIYAANMSTGVNAYGELPFLKDLSGAPYVNAQTQYPDFSTPNEAYFSYADQVLELANSYGMLVLFSPYWLGAGGGGLTTEGYYTSMVQMSEATLQGYGQYLGNRYVAFKNIIWHQGGDYNPPNKTVVENVVTGIKQYDTVHLNTVDTQDGTSPMDYWSSETWLDLNNVYTDELLGHPYVYRKTQDEYQLPNWKPMFFKEGAFEGEHSSTPQFIRSQAYEATLGGNFGEIFGNNPVWLFASGWQTALGSRGALDTTQLHDLLTPRRWDLLVPDYGQAFITNGASYTGAQYVAAALASDGSWGIAYVPNGNSVTVKLSGFSGPISLHWVDPTNGAQETVPGSPFQNAGATTLAPSGNNATGDKDWVLLVEP